MSKVGGRGSGIGDRALDAAIDAAVREMLDMEPAADLRGRVMDRIDGLSANSAASAFGRKLWWIAGPVAVAATIVLAVLVPWRGATTIERPPSTGGGDTRLAVESAPRPSIVTHERPAPIHVVTIRSSTPGPQSIRAADAAGEDVNFTSVEAVQALAGPEAIAVQRLTEPSPRSLPSIEPAPLEIRALQISALPETPRERREE